MTLLIKVSEMKKMSEKTLALIQHALDNYPDWEIAGVVKKIMKDYSSEQTITTEEP